MSYTPSFENEDQVTNWSINWLKQRGYAVTETGFQTEVLTPGELAGRFGLTSPAFHKRLHHEFCPSFNATYGPTGRVLKIATNPALIAWLKQPVRPGKPMTLSFNR